MIRSLGVSLNGMRAAGTWGCDLHFQRVAVVTVENTLKGEGWKQKSQEDSVTIIQEDGRGLDNGRRKKWLNCGYI